MKRLMSLVVVCLLATNVHAGWDPQEEAKLTKACEDAVAKFKQTDKTLQPYFDQAHGHAIFPRITKGGLIVGGSHGKGCVYQGGKMIGKATVTAATLGLQAGAQQYAELIFFQDETALNRLTDGSYEFDAAISAVAATEGAGAKTDWNERVAVFTMIEGGLMAEAAVGGQKFSFEPLTTK